MNITRDKFFNFHSENEIRSNKPFLILLFAAAVAIIALFSATLIMSSHSFAGNGDDKTPIELNSVSDFKDTISDTNNGNATQNNKNNVISDGVKNEKTKPNLTLNPTWSYCKYSPATSSTFTITTNSDGDISATVPEALKAEVDVTISSKTVTVTPKTANENAVPITINVAETETYAAASTQHLALVNIEPIYEWASDYSTCRVILSYILEEQEYAVIEEVQTTSQITVPAKETSTGIKVHTATFIKPEFTTQTKNETLPALGVHSDHDGLTWSQWSSGTSLPTSAGNYYLTNDVSLSSSSAITLSYDLNLCLNGHKITFTSANLFNVQSGKTLKIYDCRHGEPAYRHYFNVASGDNKRWTPETSKTTDTYIDGGCIVKSGTNTSSSSDAIINVQAGGACSLNNVALVGGYGKYGGAGVKVNSSSSTPGKLSIDGGGFYGNYLVSDGDNQNPKGAAIYLADSAKGVDGGDVSIKNCEFKDNSIKATGGNQKVAGAGIYCDKNVEMNITNSIFTGNQIINKINQNNSGVAISLGVNDENSSSGTGTNFNNTCTIISSNISDNYCNTSSNECLGGGIFCSNTSKLDISLSQVCNNKIECSWDNGQYPTSGGGGIAAYAYSKTALDSTVANITGCEISDNQVSCGTNAYAGGILARYATLNITDTSITGNSCESTYTASDNNKGYAWGGGMVAHADVQNSELKASIVKLAGRILITNNTSKNADVVPESKIRGVHSDNLCFEQAKNGDELLNGTVMFNDKLSSDSSVSVNMFFSGNSEKTYSNGAITQGYYSTYTWAEALPNFAMDNGLDPKIWSVCMHKGAEGGYQEIQRELYVIQHYHVPSYSLTKPDEKTGQQNLKVECVSSDKTHDYECRYISNPTFVSLEGNTDKFTDNPHPVELKNMDELKDWTGSTTNTDNIKYYQKTAEANDENDATWQELTSAPTLPGTYKATLDITWQKYDEQGGTAGQEMHTITSNEYTITNEVLAEFKCEEGHFQESTETKIKTLVEPSGGKYVLPDEPIVDDGSKLFAGWYDDEDNRVTENTIVPYELSTTMTARWGESRTITGGVSPDNSGKVYISERAQKVPSGILYAIGKETKNIILDNDETRVISAVANDGYVFWQWATKNEEAYQELPENGKFESDKTLYAMFLKTYDVRGDVPGGNGKIAESNDLPYSFPENSTWKIDSQRPNIVHISAGTRTHTITAVANDNYRFKEWKKDGSVVSGSGKINNATTFSAEFESGIEATLDCQGGKLPSTSTQSYNVKVENNKPMPKLNDVPSMDGYVFKGFFAEAGKSSSKQYYDQNGESKNNWDKNTSASIYAVWEPKTFKVKFNKNNGEGTEMTPQDFTFGVKKELNKNSYTKTGYKFLGWSTNKSAVVAEYVDKAYFPNDFNEYKEQVTLYVVWQEKNDVSIDETVQNSAVYDSTAKSFEVKVNSGPADDYKLAYSQSGTAVASPKDAGSYDVTVTHDETDDYKSFSKTITGRLVINPATITVTPSPDQSMTYTGAAPENITYTNTGAVSGQTAAFTGALALKDGKVDAGDHEIVQGSLALIDGTGEFKAANYTLALPTTAVTYKITPATITVTPSPDQSMTYTGAAPENITYTNTGAVSGQTAAFTGALKLENNVVNAGSHNIVIGTLELADSSTTPFKKQNYSLSLVENVKYSILKATPILKLSAETATYTLHHDATFTYEYNGDGENANVVVTPTDPQYLTATVNHAEKTVTVTPEKFSDSTTISITIKVEAGSNYNAAEATQTATVIKDTLQAGDFEFKAPGVGGKVTYDEQHHPAEIKYSGSASCGDITIYYETFVPSANNTLASINTKTNERTKDAPVVAGNYKTSINVEANDEYDAATNITAEEWVFKIKKAASPKPAPSTKDVTITLETLAGKNDGYVDGVTEDMEYSLDGGETWISVKPGQTTIEGLGECEPQIRYKGDKNHEPSVILQLSAPAGELSKMTYSPNEADGGKAPVDSKEYKFNDKVTVLGNTGNLTKTGFEFVCWNTQADGTGKDYFEGDEFTYTEAGTTLYVKWKELPANPEVPSSPAEDNAFTSSSTTGNTGDSLPISACVLLLGLAIASFGTFKSLRDKKRLYKNI